MPGPDVGAECQPTLPTSGTPCLVPPGASFCLRPRAVPRRRPPLRLQFHRFRRNRGASGSIARSTLPTKTRLPPYVRLNGAIAGVPEQGGAFYRDVSPGRYQITVDSEGMSPSPYRDVALVAGEQIYARIGLGGSWNGQGFTITVAPSEVGHAAIEHSKFYGG